MVMASRSCRDRDESLVPRPLRTNGILLGRIGRKYCMFVQYMPAPWELRRCYFWRLVAFVAPAGPVRRK
jgi:hypothetical protein